MTRRDEWYGARIAVALLLSFLAHAMLASVSEGRPNIRDGFFAAYPSAVGTRLDNLPSIAGHCGACHYRFTGGGPRNPYGAAVEAAIGSFPNTDDGRRLAVLSVQNVDQDGDGFLSVTEITNLASYTNTPTFPGLNPTNVSQVTNVNVNDILAYLVPTTGAGDTTPPTVAVLAPNGGQSWTGGQQQAITWTATDNVGVTSVDLFYRDSESQPWTPIMLGVANTGSFTWFVHNTPSASARVRILARDAVGNTSFDQSDNLFTILIKSGGIVPTTLRDFHQPGTQPFGAGSFEPSTDCLGCHGGYDTAVEPGHNFKGTLMAQAARDPLFFACLAIAEQDAPSSGDLCLRCHTPFGWMSGRSNPTDGTQLTAPDRDGVACGFCHRVVDPVYKPGISPLEDQAVLSQLATGDLPLTYSNGQFVVDPDSRKRGPYEDAGAYHPRLYSPLHTSSDFCGTCHDVSNPVFDRTGADDYTPGPLDQKATSLASTDLMPLERTYSEWKNSAYPGGVYAPEFAGNKPGGTVSTCQDCHMKDVSGMGAVEGAPVRPDLPLHDMTGGNAWIPSIVASLYPGETDAAALNAGAQRAVSMLQRAAGLGVTYAVEGDSFRALVTVTNRTGHKLPTGYPEGRRMWLHVVARNAQGQKIYESGAYDAATGVLSTTPEPVVYECKLGVSPGLGGAVGVPSGPTFHFTLNDTVVKDNRVPPAGFTNAAFASFGGRPVDPHHAGPEPRYVDGQNWDVAEYPLPPNAHSVAVRLLYQTTSKEYVEFLRDENTTNTAGDDLYNLWVANGRGAPVEMERDSIAMTITSVDEGSPITQNRLAVLRNPFERALDLKLDLVSPAAVNLRVYDIHGRQVLDRNYGIQSGSSRLTWDGRDRRGETVRAGVYWAVVRAGDKEWKRQIVRIR